MRISIITILPLIAFLSVGCKDEIVEPAQQDKIIKCSGCSVKRVPVLDTIIIKK